VTRRGPGVTHSHRVPAHSISHERHVGLTAPHPTWGSRSRRLPGRECTAMARFAEVSPHVCCGVESTQTLGSESSVPATLLSSKGRRGRLRPLVSRHLQGRRARPRRLVSRTRQQECCVSTRQHQAHSSLHPASPCPSSSPPTLHARPSLNRHDTAPPVSLIPHLSLPYPHSLKGSGRGRVRTTIPARDPLLELPPTVAVAATAFSARRKTVLVGTA
jgi:hypothetical protein